ncbi:asparagine synthase (glutamine-hydrolyzing) [Aureimonas leprariae]|uniref:asparagine synthase (glutamine-hydrolyzing) n=1 Tax=Plantimonas leprariae TaxID=2615207 RepID=A0A7V7PK54_9HYPH|nr:asparagine synthase (glutamine-hydrolyzing) [Aureimonas leprariae]KAB0675909.1 asparagine synthase (glutamine-hydrolyzing) [Aureimonas leprariae]
MCGLFGSIGFEPDRSSIDRIGHRGPDGTGWQVFDSAGGPVALGHRRLAIIDISDAGLQPMPDASGRFQLVFNGEIYNYLELREEMRARGEVFVSDSDSEVLLRAYMVWGKECLSRLRGMFAFLIWDDREKTLFAARDRYGIKPLYVFEGPAGIAFASEIKQFLGMSGWTGRMNVARVHDFLGAGISDHTEETMFDGVRQLRGGECAEVAIAGRSIRTRIERWYPATAGSLDIGEEEAAERFRELFDESVRLHLRSDVQIGSCLSGGLDSSAIVCVMARELGGGAGLNTVSACYPNKEVDEKPFMEAVVRATGARPHYVFPRADDVFARAVDITWHQDEPFGSSSIFAQWCVFEEAKRAGVKVMLDGQGADEQLAGYHGSFPYYMAGLRKDRLRRQIVRTILERKRYHGTPIAPLIREYLLPLLPTEMAGRIAARLPGTVPAPAARDWLSGPAIRESGNPKGAFPLATERLDLPPVEDLRSLCLTLTYASNLQMLLHWEDRNSMAHSIEARVPFLDHPLVEFTLALGNSHKIVGGDTKRVLRRAMRGVLPHRVRERRDKLGFATPEQAWFRGPLKGLVHDGVEASLRRFPELFDANETRGLVGDMLEGRRPVDFTLWRIVNMSIWGERFGIAA